MSQHPEVQHIATPWPAPPAGDADVAERWAWCVAVARWAPSKHNSQPWRFVLRGHALELWVDPQRALPDTDPQRRELVLSCGSAAHLVVLAARCLGKHVSVDLLPDGAGSLLARFVEIGDIAVAPEDQALLETVPTRRTDRGPLDGESMTEGASFLLQTAAAAEGASLRLVASPGDRATLARLVERADRILVQRPELGRELAHWVREEGDERPDGVPASHTRGAGQSYRAEFVQRDFSTVISLPEHDRPGIDRPVLGIITTNGDHPLDWMVAGQALMAVLLRAELAGGHASYLNQPVEEPKLRTELRNDLALTGTAQLVLRIGVGGDVSAPARRGLEELLIQA